MSWVENGGAGFTSLAVKWTPSNFTDLQVGDIVIAAMVNLAYDIAPGDVTNGWSWVGSADDGNPDGYRASIYYKEVEAGDIGAGLTNIATGFFNSPYVGVDQFRGETLSADIHVEGEFQLTAVADPTLTLVAHGDDEPEIIATFSSILNSRALLLRAVILDRRPYIATLFDDQSSYSLTLTEGGDNWATSAGPGDFVKEGGVSVNIGGFEFEAGSMELPTPVVNEAWDTLSTVATIDHDLIIGVEKDQHHLESHALQSHTGGLLYKVGTSPMVADTDFVLATNGMVAVTYDTDDGITLLWSRANGSWSSVEVNV